MGENKLDKFKLKSNLIKKFKPEFGMLEVYFQTFFNVI